MHGQPRIRVSAILRWQDMLLLCRHEKHGREYWLLPGGGVDAGESLVGALHRELHEEVGIEDSPPVEGPVAIVDSITPAGSLSRKHVVEINAAHNKLLQDPGVLERLAKQGIEPQAMTPETFAALLRADYQKMARVVKASGARID